MKALILASILLASLYPNQSRSFDQGIQDCQDQAIETQGESERVSNDTFIRECVSDWNSEMIKVLN